MYWTHRQPETHLLATALLFREMRSSSINIQAQAPPTKKTSQDTNPTPSTRADSTAKNNYDLKNFFFSYKSHCLFPLHNSTFTLAFCSAVEFSSLLFLLKKIFSSFFSCHPPFFCGVSDFVFDTFDCLSYRFFFFFFYRIRLSLSVPKSLSHMCIFAFLFFLFTLTF